jgi:LL-H family phage holin
MDALFVELFDVAIVVVTALVGVATRYVVKFLKAKGVLAKLEGNKELVKIVVGAVEQTHKHLEGREKLNMAKIELVKLMNEKGVKISEKEIDLLIESSVKEMNQVIKEETK